MNQTPKPDLGSPDSKRLLKFKLNNQSKISHFNKLNQIHLPKQYNANNHLHVPGKINFHELLSLPLQKQIQKQNSLKSNQTFSLKFQPDLSQRQSNNHHSKQSLNKVGSKNSRFLSRKSLITQKGHRIKKDMINNQFEEIKQAARTMYFRPIGKIARNYENENQERKSLQISRNVKSKQSKKVEIGASVYKDKLLMLLQIRKQERMEKKSASALGNGLGSYRQINKLNMTEGFQQKIDRSKSYRSRCTYSSYRSNVKEELVIPKFKRTKFDNLQTEDGANPSQLSPWYLVENGQDF